MYQTFIAYYEVSKTLPGDVQDVYLSFGKELTRYQNIVGHVLAIVSFNVDVW